MLVRVTSCVTYLVYRLMLQEGRKRSVKISPNWERWTLRVSVRTRTLFVCCGIILSLFLLGERTDLRTKRKLHLNMTHDKISWSQC